MSAREPAEREGTSPPWSTAPATPETPLPARADALVLGAGLAGSAVALGLARGGVRVVLVADKPPGRGGGTANGPGAAILGPPDPLHVLVKAIGRERAEDLYRLSR